MSAATVPPPPKEDRGDSLNAVNGVFLGVGLILVCLRIFVRTRINKTFGWDDGFIILALICAFVAMGMGAASVHYGIGQHIIYLKPSHIAQAVKWNRVGQMPLVASTMFTKLSISIFLYRIFATNAIRRWIIYPIIFLNVVGNLASFTTILPQCSPVAKLWNPALSGTCWNARTQIDIALFQGAVSVFCDFALAFLPAMFLWNVHIKRHIKLGICCLMGLGFFTGGCAIARTALLAAETPVDYTYSIVPLSIWATLEMSIGIILACVPTIRPLFNSEFLDHVRTLLGRSYTNNYETKVGYVRHADDWQRLNRRHTMDDPMHLYPGWHSSLESQTTTAQAYGNIVRAQKARSADPVLYGNGISKTTEFQLETIDR